MPRLFACLAVIMLLPMTGCLNSEKDYEQLVEEKNNLAAELEAADRENEILTRALENIKKEQEALQILLNTSRGQLAGASGAGGAQTPPLSGEPSTVSWGGWEWSIPADALPDPAPSPGNNSRPPAAAPPIASGRIYQPRPGDVLSAIATRNNTTVEELVELNPFLQSRRDYMIRETDRIQLP